jgi:long-chain fatty acid transport protein
MPRNITQIALGSLICAGFFPGSLVAQTGHVLNGEGPVNQSMAGVATATPLDASGALLWNSAAITALPGNSIQFGMEMLKPSIDLASAVPGTSGLVSGSTSSDSAVSPIPSFSLVYHIPDSDLTFGMNAVGVSGFGVNYPASNSNPLLMAPPNGFGSVYSNFQMLQLSPTIAYQVNKNWSLGFAPNIDQASLAITPACFEAPNDPDGVFGNGDEVYASGLNTATAWGFGVQAGVFYQGDGDWNFGASFKSQQAFKDFEFNSTDATGAYRQLKLDMDFPAIASIGVAYRGFDKMIIGLDARYIDYKNTDGFDAAGFAADGSVTGFGWDSIMVVALGAQFAVDECLSIRAGYAFNENPIADENSTFNVPAPAIIQQHASVGMSYCVGHDWFFDVAYQHGFENSIEGEMGHPLMGFVPGSSVENTMSTDSLIIGFRVLF